MTPRDPRHLLLAVALFVAACSSGASSGEVGPAGPTGPTGPQGVAGPAGDAGPQGPLGPAGPPGLAWRGTWAGATSYAPRDAVQHQGSTYVAVAPSTAIAPPSVEWELLAAEGAPGAQGPAGPAGPAGPPGAAGPTGPAGAPGTVAFGTTAGTAAEGNDPRLSDARAPAPGSPSYIQNGTVPQAASLNVTGDGGFGGAVIAARFVGNGASLTSISAESLSGRIPDAALSANVVLRSDPLLFPQASEEPATPTAGRAYLDTTTRTLRFHDGVSWRTVAVATGFGPRTANASSLPSGAVVSILGFAAPPVVTVWVRVGSTRWSNVTGNAAFPTEFDAASGTVTVANGSGAPVDLTVSAAGM